jgi:hypothetical protein
MDPFRNGTISINYAALNKKPEQATDETR